MKETLEKLTKEVARLADIQESALLEAVETNAAILSQRAVEMERNRERNDFLSEIHTGSLRSRIQDALESMANDDAGVRAGIAQLREMIRSRLLAEMESATEEDDG